MYSRNLLFVNFLYIVFFLINCAEGEFQGIEIKIYDHNESINIPVTKVDNSYLVNVHVPVWKMINDEFLPYEKITVMPKIGDITSYFNYEKKAAVIYSSKCNCLNGVIGMRYIIQKFPMHLIYNTQIIGESLYIMRKAIKPNKPPNLSKEDAPQSEEDLKMNERAVNRTLYPEILIVVKNDFYTNWKPSIDDEEIVLYIISLMNAVDMLYSPAEVLKVKLNIAGIIIESQQNRLPVIADYGYKEFLSVESLVNGVRNSNYTYFEKFKLDPKMSYDWIFFLTSKKLSYYDHHNLKRMSSYPKKGIVQSRQEGCGTFNTPISIITDDYKFNSFPTIGHEIFHLIIQGSHKVAYSTCHLGFLDVYDVLHLEKFQWSNDCCLLINKPQSLNFKQPPLNPKYQCQCYGYEKNYFVDPTECTEMIICEDASKNEQTVPRIVDDEFCREKWERKRVELQGSLHYATSTPSTTTTTFIPPLVVENQSSWITPNELSNLVFIFPRNNEESDDDGLVCLAIMIEGNSDEDEMAFTAKSCMNKDVKQIKLRKHLIRKERDTIIAESQAEADFLVTEKLINGLDHDTVSLRSIDIIADNFIKLSSLKTSEEILNSRFKECRFINVTKVSDSIKPFIIQYIRVDILIESMEGSTSNYVIRSKNPVDKSELWGLKGNPLFCKIKNSKVELVGILVNDDYNGKYLRFVNIADYKEVIENSME